MVDHASHFCREQLVQARFNLTLSDGSNAKFAPSTGFLNAFNLMECCLRTDKTMCMCAASVPGGKKRPLVDRKVAAANHQAAVARILKKAKFDGASVGPKA